MRSTSLWFPLFTALSLVVTACPGPDPLSPPQPEPEENLPTFSAADIGTPCVYDAAVPENPTNDCEIGLTCLIVTRDYGNGSRGYAPFQAGDAANLQLPVWENHFTYYRADGKDEGYCTLVQTQTAFSQTCPAGTTTKALWPNLVVCVKNCDQPLDCNREGFTCDERFVDVSSAGGDHCVRKCTNDVPDCLRNGWFNVDGTVSAYLAVQDLQGASSCDLTSGQCIGTPENGTAGPGERCNRNADCLGGQICLSGPLIGQPDQSAGACGQPCVPVANPQNEQDLQATCFPGSVCQPGLQGGHDPYNVINDEYDVATWGGYCFAKCAGNGDCSAQQGTSCGQIDEAVFGAAWNGVSICLVAELRAGN